MNRNATLILLGTAALLGIAVACRASIRTGPNVPIIPGSEITVEIDPDSGTITIPPPPDEPNNPPAGTCIKLTFYDSSGNPIGSVDSTVGNTPAPVPPGTAGVTWSPCDPPEEPQVNPPPKVKRPKDARMVVSSARRFPYNFASMENGVVGGKVVNYYVLAGSAAEAQAGSDAFLKSLFQVPPPANIELGSGVYSGILADGRVQVTLFSAAAPVSLSVWWNDAPLAQLGDATVTPWNGWVASTVMVPADQVDSDLFGNSSNSVRFELTTEDGTMANTVSVATSP